MIIKKDCIDFDTSGNIHMIYIDPPFSTNRDFYYESEKAFSDKFSINSLIRYLKPRLLKLYNLLEKNGTFWFHCDPRFSHYIKIELDNIFGQRNFRNEIIWEYNSGARTKKDFGKRHDVLFRYSKSSNYIFNPIREPYSQTAPRGYDKEKYYHENGKVMGDVWKINSIAQNQKIINGVKRKRYPTEKPYELIKRIILSSTNEKQTILDPMAGSGVVGIVAKDFDRNYILIDNSQVSVNLMKKNLCYR